MVKLQLVEHHKFLHTQVNLCLLQVWIRVHVGFYGSDKECKCSEEAIKKYLGKISGPLLDRIDIQVEVSSVKYDNLNSNVQEESSKDIQKRVNIAREIQLKRYEGLGIYSNSELTPKLMQEFCKLDNSGELILKQAFEKIGLSARAYGRILKVARTIADLDGSKNILDKHLLEAVQYRRLDKKYDKF